MRESLPPLLLLLLLLLRGTGGQVNCRAGCDGYLEGDKVPDPSNCLQYYYCSDPDGDGIMVTSDDPVRCPDGTYFNAQPQVMNCDTIPVSGEFCVDLCNPCKLQCKEPGTLLAEPLDCNLYQICLQDLTSIYDTCPSDAPYFDYLNSACTNDPSLCFDLCDPCMTYCTDQGKVPDPYDCTAYYLCDPPVLSHFTCPEDEVFNPGALVCQEVDGNCTAMCY